MARFLLVLRWILQECGDFTWWVSDCEELVGLLTGDDVGYSEYNFKTELEIQYLTVMQ